MCPSISAASSPCLMLKCVLCCSESYPSCMLLLAYQSLSCSVAQPSSQIRSIRRSRVFPQFHCQISHYLCFILWLVESRRFANRCRHCWCGNALLVPFGAVLLHILINGHLFVVIIIMSSRCLPSCSSELSPLRLAGLTHLKLLSSSTSLQSKARVWGVDVLVCEDSRYLLKYWFVKAIPSCGGVIYMTCSRVARFDDDDNNNIAFFPSKLG